jgi:hypothetical protein
MPKKEIDDKSGKFQDAVNREEIRGVLNQISRAVNGLSGNDLELLKKYLKDC